MSELSELRQAVARIETDVGWIRQSIGQQVTRTDKHEERLGKVEGRQWWMTGIFTAIGALFGAGVGNGIKH
jgi:hypothetical protein